MGEAQKTLLVVEDEKPLQEAIKAKLIQEGFKVVTAVSVPGALEALEHEKSIQAVWLDHYLVGKQDGLDLVKKLKEDDSPWKALPVFLVSNTASQDKVRAYMRLGVNEYYVKATNRLGQIVEDVKAEIK